MKMIRIQTPGETILCDLTVEEQVKKRIFLRFLAVCFVLILIPSYVEFSLIFTLALAAVLLAGFFYLCFIKYAEIRLTLTNKRIIASYYATLLLRHFDATMDLKDVREIKGFYMPTLVYGANLIFMLITNKDAPPLPGRAPFTYFTKYANRNIKTSIPIFLITGEQYNKFTQALKNTDFKRDGQGAAQAQDPNARAFHN